MSEAATPAPADAKLLTTRDLALAAWYHMHGLPIVRARRNGRTFDFLFRDERGRRDQLAIDWANSEAHRFDASLRILKKLCTRNNGKGV